LNWGGEAQEDGTLLLKFLNIKQIPTNYYLIIVELESKRGYIIF
jgi:hypothetical protein